MDPAQAVGLAAAFCTSTAYLPQVLRSWERRSAKDISWGMLGLTTVGMFLWLSYGLMISDFPIIAANAFTELLVLVLVWLKFKYG